MSNAPGQLGFVPIAQEQQAYLNSVLTQSNRFLDRAQGKKFGSAFNSDVSHGNGPMTVSFILHNRKELEAGRFILVDKLKVSPQTFQINFEPSWSWRRANG